MTKPPNGKEANVVLSDSNVAVVDELVLYVEKSRWEFLKKETGSRFCIQAYSTVENERGFIKFRASPN